MSSKQFGEMFEGDSADTCARKFLELELFVRLLSLAICTISGSIYPWYLEGLFLMEGKFPPLSDTSDDDVVVTVNFFG